MNGATPIRRQTKANPGDVEELIEKRINEKLPALTLELRDRIEEHFEKHKARRTALLSFSVALAAGALGFLGFKTYHEIHDLVVREAIKQAQQEFTAPETKRQVHTIMRRALLDSYLTSLARNEASPQSAAPFSVRDIDIDQLLDILADPITEDAEFGQVVKVLVSTQQNITSLPTLADKVADKFGVILGTNRNPRKTLVLLRQLTGSRITNPAISAACRELIVGGNASDNEVRRAAIFHAGETRDDNASQSLIRIAEDLRNPLRATAMIALAKIDAESDIVARWADSFVKNKSGQDLWTAFDIADALWTSANGNAAIHVLESCFKKGAALRWSQGRLYAIKATDDDAGIRAITDWSNLEIPSELIKPNIPDQETALERLVGECAKRSDVAELVALSKALPILALTKDGPSPFTLTVFAPNDASGVKLENGKTLRANKLSVTLDVVSELKASGKGPSSLAWKDTATRSYLKVIGFENVQELRFKLVGNPDILGYYQNTIGYDDYSPAATEQSSPNAPQ
ncbi:MAG: hypothetical protein QOF24_2361 [Verrucomicrobiota bacterium]|jgi:hypothetical protein